MQLVIRGNLIDGWEFIGPFKEPNEAEEWAVNNDNLFEWVIAELEDPADHELIDLDDIDLEGEADDDEEELEELEPQDEVLPAIPMFADHHEHKWERGTFIGGTEIRHCLNDCVATEVKNSKDEWERVA